MNDIEKTIINMMKIVTNGRIDTMDKLNKEFLELEWDNPCECTCKNDRL